MSAQDESKSGDSGDRSCASCLSNRNSVPFVAARFPYNAAVTPSTSLVSPLLPAWGHTALCPQALQSTTAQRIKASDGPLIWLLVSRRKKDEQSTYIFLHIVREGIIGTNRAGFQGLALSGCCQHGLPFSTSRRTGGRRAPAKIPNKESRFRPRGSHPRSASPTVIVSRHLLTLLVNGL